MLAFLTRLLLVFSSRLKSQVRLQAENVVLRHQLLVLNRKAPAGFDCGTSIVWFWCGCIESSHRFWMPSSSSSLRRCSAGIDVAFERIGAGSLDAVEAVQESTASFVR